MANPVLQIRVPPAALERYKRAADASALKLSEWIRTELARASQKYAAPPAPPPVPAPTPAPPAPVSEVERLFREGKSARQIVRETITHPKTPPALGRYLDSLEKKQREEREEPEK